jgi:CRP-like cAMP-binding protein
LSNTTIFTFLDSISFFEVFSQKEKESLASINNIFIKYIGGDYIIRENDHEEAVYIILKGNVIITKNEIPDVVLSQLSAGAVFGEISLMDKRPRSTNVSSVSEVVVMKLDKVTIGKLPLVMQNKLHQRFINILVKRLDEMNEKYLRVSRPTKDSK